MLASGIAIMSDSSIALKPVIEEPSKPIPPSNASSSCSELMLNDFSDPRMSVNHRRMKRMSRSCTIALTSSGVWGVSTLRAIELLRGRRAGKARRLAAAPRRRGSLAAA